MKWIRQSENLTESSDRSYCVWRVDTDRSRSYEAWNQDIKRMQHAIVGADYETAREAQQACETHARARLEPSSVLTVAKIQAAKKLLERSR